MGMRSFSLLAVMGLAFATAWAQPAAERNAGSESNVPAQRRADLRQALKTEPLTKPDKRELANAAVAASRQLSAQERAELRKVLRQQTSEPKPEQGRSGQ